MATDTSLRLDWSHHLSWCLLAALSPGRRCGAVLKHRAPVKLNEALMCYPLVNVHIAVENGPVEIVDFPIENGGSFHGKMLIHQRVSKKNYQSKLKFRWRNSDSTPRSLDSLSLSLSIPSTPRGRYIRRRKRPVYPKVCRGWLSWTSSLETVTIRSGLPLCRDVITWYIFFCEPRDVFDDPLRGVSGYRCFSPFLHNPFLKKWKTQGQTLN